MEFAQLREDIRLIRSCSNSTFPMCGICGRIKTRYAKFVAAMSAVIS